VNFPFVVSGVDHDPRRTLELYEKLTEATIERERTVIGHQAATGKRFDQPVYELYGLTEEEGVIVEDRYVAHENEEWRRMLGKAVQDAMNEQLNNELFSAYQYLSMAAYCEGANLPGFAHWMRSQSQEELEHAMKFYDFILERNGRVVLGAIDQPVVDFGSPLEVFEQALGHEQKVTEMINDLYGLAATENDYASQTFLQWFVTEQVEEEKNAGDVLENLKMVGDKSEALFLLDRELGRRGNEESHSTAGGG
jgi:ferritin